MTIIDYHAFAYIISSYEEDHNWNLLMIGYGMRLRTIETISSLNYLDDISRINYYVALCYNSEFSIIMVSLIEALCFSNAHNYKCISMS